MRLASYEEMVARVDDGLRGRIADELPELSEIADQDLRSRCVEAWAIAIANSSYSSIADIPPAGNPEKMVQTSGDQTGHIRGVTRLSIVIADEMAESNPELRIDRDILVAGAICHDVGKPWEFDPENRRRWKNDRGRYGLPSLRHPTYGAHLCLMVGLPEEVAHISAGHSGEGELMIRSLENTIVHMADIGYWQIMLAGGLIQDGTISDKYKRPLSL